MDAEEHRAIMQQVQELEVRSRAGSVLGCCWIWVFGFGMPQVCAGAEPVCARGH